MATEAELTTRIAARGDDIRALKAAAPVDKAQLAAAVADLLALKDEFKRVTGKDFGPPPAPKKAAKAAAETASAPPVKDPSQKSKKELNKERKKAQKAAASKGSDEPAEPTPAAKQQQQQPAAAAAALTPAGPFGRVLPVPAADEIAFSAASRELPLAAFVLAQLTKPAVTFTHHAHERGLAPTLALASGSVVSGDFAIARFLARAKPGLGLYGLETDALVASQVDSWLDFALARFSSTLDRDSAHRGLALLDRVLRDRTFLVGYALSLADVGVWARVTAAKADVAPFAHVARWLRYLNSQDVFATAAATLQALPPVASRPSQPSRPSRPSPSAANPPQVSQKGKSTGSCPPLKDAVDGQVVTRFPPEPSGYLHIGHVKACMLNDYYARRYHGKLIVRFDDTNPSKEKDEFEQSILADLKRLDIVADQVSYTSDHFPTIIAFARQLIADGLGYMDNTPQDQMRDERMHGVPSLHRTQDPDTARRLFDLMLANDPEASGYCLRGRIDMQAKNKTLRDPVFFRANATPHHRTGTTYCAYPTYDFACPIVDSIEGVTHALRTTEYNDRDFQYQWVLTALKLRKVHIQGFARMNFVHSVLSKRKLQWFVDNGHVEGWTDPRFPTVQGVLRRGVQVPALREFILSQGASRRITDMEWDKFWTLNKRVLDPVAPRYYALDQRNTVPLTLTNVPDGVVVGEPVARHPKDPALGHKVMRFARRLLLERDDVAAMAEGDDVTLMRHGNFVVTKLTKDAATGRVTHVEGRDDPTGDFKKTKLKVTWLADLPDLVPATLVEFDHLLSKPKLEDGDNFVDHLTPVTRAEMAAVGDHELRTAKRGDIVQLERRGYFRVDRPYLSPDKPLVLFMVPDGKAKAMSTLSKNLAHR
ncbi:hypothetical protein PybrP1_012794 [[Pythium] brassicae (nom. inval.)]|nr:hypothetical protein PybrP1_012794 [[Pythium] brassicae (nom. inval.)]